MDSTDIIGWVDKAGMLRCVGCADEDERFEPIRSDLFLHAMEKCERCRYMLHRAQFYIDGLEQNVCTFEQFVCANAPLDLDTIRALVHLRVGQTFVGGGGAWRTWAVTRTA